MSIPENAPTGAWLHSVEELVDVQTTATTSRDRQFVIKKGHALLHASGPSGTTLCGKATAGLTETGCRWGAYYPRHIRRCDTCARAAGNFGRSGGVAGPGSTAATAQDAVIRLVHGGTEERQASACLRAVLNRYDLRRWMFTDLVTIDAGIRGAFSHPLTISPPLLMGRPACALTTFLHEQLHWMPAPEIGDAIDEMAKLYQDPPPPPAGCASPESTWLHLVICSLEYQSLSSLIGAEPARAELQQHNQYSWVYKQILEDPLRFRTILGRHRITLPASHPVPLRFITAD